MITVQNAKDGTRKPPKRMLAAGRKIDGVWQVKTFLRGAVNGAETFWEARRGPKQAR
jgi:hypothetical protein